jgi:hypothetical protein
MKKPHLLIHLDSAQGITIESNSLFRGHPVNLTFDLKHLANDVIDPSEIGKFILLVLGEWHSSEFASIGLMQPIDEPVFGDLDVVERLIEKCLTQKTDKYASTIEDLLANHEESGGDTNKKMWEVLAEDWPRIRTRLQKSS